ncbi:MAG: serine kinase [Calditrichaeota bacterium]|nr:serine kinase [Calditrichota bacterium]
MRLHTIIEKTGLDNLTTDVDLDCDVKGVYVSDLLSDVIANVEAGALWVTLQVHPNIIAVAALKDLAGVILVNDRQPETETLKKAEQEGIPILTTRLSTYQIAGRLFNLVGEC